MLQVAGGGLGGWGRGRAFCPRPPGVPRPLPAGRPRNGGLAFFGFLCYFLVLFLLVLRAGDPQRADPPFAIRRRSPLGPASPRRRWAGGAGLGWGWGWETSAGRACPSRHGSPPGRPGRETASAAGS